MSLELRDTIAKAAEACRQKNAEQFAALFTPEGELVLARGQNISGRKAIARVTADYFATCEQIDIEIQKIRIDSDRAIVQWIWYSVDCTTGEPKRAENILQLDFHGTAISCWQETVESQQ